MNESRPLTRRTWLKTGMCGFGYMAFAGLCTEQAHGAYRSPLAARRPHFAPRAKRVIFLFMQGGPSHVDTFDHKPRLAMADGKSAPKTAKGRGNLLGSQWKFSPHGESGLMISSLFPNLARHADDLCLLNGMHTDNPAHPQATIMLHTGSINFVRPSVGAWTVYGLGTENRNLPGFVTINPVQGLGGAQNHGSAFLPASYQGASASVGRPEVFANIQPQSGSRDEQRRYLDLVQSMNRELLERSQVNSEIEGVIQSYELAFRMQREVPQVLDVKGEPAAVREAYGLGHKETRSFGMQCLMARRLAEAGVRYIEITHRGWDQHKDLRRKLAANAAATDRPIAALIADLKQRGLLDETLLVWGGEFGRTPQAQDNSRNGRRHNNRGFTMWMAGGGVKGGIRHGATDEIGDTAAENKVHTHDLHATMLHLLGLDHERLTYRYAGRDFRLTDVYGDVVTDILA